MSHGAESLEAEIGRWARELRKGSTRLALLTVLARGETYGYEILSGLRSSGLVSQGATEATVYPLLHDLEARGFLRGRWKASSDGVPPRKYYRITRQGTALLEGLRRSWRDFRKEMDRVISHG